MRRVPVDQPTRQCLLVLFLAAGLGLGLPTTSLGELRVSGRVLRAGAPVVHARLTLTPVLADFERESLRLSKELEPVAVDQTRTNAEGSFELIAPQAGMWVVKLQGPGFLPMEYWLTPLVEERRLPPAEVAQSSQLGVTIETLSAETNDTKPVSGGIVWLEKQHLGKNTWIRSEAITRTDENGLALLPARAGEHMTLNVLADGLMVRRERTKAPESVQLTLQRGSEVSVTVQDKAGNVLSGVLVRHQEGWPIGFTTADGKLDIPLASDGLIEVEALAPNGGRGLARIRGAQSSIIVLYPPQTVAGRVIDRETRRPIAGAVVWVEGKPESFVRCDKDGRYELTSKAIQGQVVASAPGYLTMTESVPGLGMEDHTFSGPTFALERATAEVGGLVIGPHGRAVADAQVAARSRLGYENSRVTFTTSEGRFRLFRLPAQTDIEVTASHPSYGNGTARSGKLDDGQVRSDLRLKLGRLRRAYGRVLSKASRPIAGAIVSLFQGSNEPAVQVTTDAQGSFRFGSLEPGRMRMEVRAAGYAHESKLVELPAGAAPYDLGQFILTPEVKLEGIVLNREGQGIRGAEVFVRESLSVRRVDVTGRPAGEARGVSDESGRLEIPGFKEGEVLHLEIWHENFLPRTLSGLEIREGKHWEFTLERGLEVRGRVEDENGDPLARAWVSLGKEGTRQPVGFGERTTYTNEGGHFHFRRLESGTVTITVVAEGFVTEQMRGVRVTSEEGRKEVHLTLRRGGAIEGRVLEPDGSPAIGASVRVVEKTSGVFDMVNQLQSDRADGDGRFLLQDIETGVQSISADHPNFSTVVKRVDVRTGIQELELQFRKERGFSVSGRVLSAEDFAGNGLSLVPLGGGRSVTTLTEVGGEFEFRSVPPGRYVIRPADSQQVIPRDRQQVSVSDGPVTGLEIPLSQGATISGRLMGLAKEETLNTTVTAISGLDSRRARVNAEFGTYTITGLTEGVWEIVGKVRAGGRVASGVVALSEDSDEVQHDLDFSGDVDIEGYVFLGDEPLAWSQVELRAESFGTHHSTFTDEEGHFEVRGVEPGTYVLEILSAGASNFAGGALLHREIVGLESDTELVIDVAPGVISGRVSDSRAGTGLEDVEVTLSQWKRDSSQQVLTAISGSTGWFTLDPVPPGEWILSAKRRGYETVEVKLDVKRGDVISDLNLELRPTQGQDLEIVVPSGASPTAVKVEVLDDAGHQVASERVVAESTGSFHVATVPPGRWNLLIRSEPGGFVAALADVSVPGPPLFLTLELSGSLSVEVPSLQSQALGPEAIAVGGAGGVFPPVRIGSLRFGSLRAQWFLPGDWEIIVPTADGGLLRGRLEVRAGQENHLILDGGR